MHIKCIEKKKMAEEHTKSQGTECHKSKHNLFAEQSLNNLAYKINQQNFNYKKEILLLKVNISQYLIRNVH